MAFDVVQLGQESFKLPPEVSLKSCEFYTHGELCQKESGAQGTLPGVLQKRKKMSCFQCREGPLNLLSPFLGHRTPSGVESGRKESFKNRTGTQGRRR